MPDCSIGVQNKDFKMNIIWDLQKKPKTYTCDAYKTTLICKKTDVMHYNGDLTLKLNLAGPVATRRLRVGT